MRGVEAADGHGLAVHRALDDLVPVDGGGHGAAHLDVVEGRLGVVHGEDHFALGRADVHPETWIGFELRQQFRCGETGEGVKFLGHHRGGGGSGVRDEAEHHLIRGS